MRLNQHRLTPWALAALLSLGLGRNGAAQTSNPSDTVVTAETAPQLDISQ